MTFLKRLFERIWVLLYICIYNILPMFKCSMKKLSLSLSPPSFSLFSTFFWSFSLFHTLVNLILSLNFFFFSLSLSLSLSFLLDFFSLPSSLSYSISSLSLSVYFSLSLCLSLSFNLSSLAFSHSFSGIVILVSIPTMPLSIDEFQH